MTARHTPHITVRPADIDTDLPAITDLLNHFENRPVDVDTVRAWFVDFCDPVYLTCRLVALDECGTISGYARLIHDKGLPGGYFRAWVCVEPEKQEQGIGSALWSASEAYLRQVGGRQILTEVDGADPGSRRFAEKCGFGFSHHLAHSVLDLSSFDETPYLPAIAALEGQGIRFTSYAGFPATPENRRKLWDLNETNIMDAPNAAAGRVPFEEFEKFIIDAAWFKGEGQILAVDGDNWIGLCAVSLSSAEHTAHNEHTGVLRAYRGRKIALALKVLAACYARERGATEIDTHNDSRNTPMLAINKKLGYVEQGGIDYLVRWLAPPEEAE